jgi:protein-tyrosine-phosphatase
MAEALINGLARGQYQAWSAGSHPAEYVHPKSIETLTRHGIDPGQPRSKSWHEFAEVAGSEAEIDAAFDETFFLPRDHVEELKYSSDAAITERDGAACEELSFNRSSGTVSRSTL